MDDHRLQKYKKLVADGVSPFINSYNKNKDIGEIYNNHINFSKEELDSSKPQCIVAGRVIGNRAFGKATFLTLRDRSGEIQIYIRKDTLDPQDYNVFIECETGDFIAVEGFLFKTKTGELTVCAEKLTLLTKSLRDLPEKWHGLKDVEKRYRQRYVDLISNEGVKELFIKRSLIVRYLREFFISKGFLEVETPMMQPIAGGAAAKPFITHHNALDMALYLRIAPELYLKRLVVGGLERVFEINRNFRNEGVSVRHNPEFTMIEWYMAYADYQDLMDMIEEFFVDISTKINGKPVAYLELQNQEGEPMEINLEGPWPRLTMQEALIQYSDVDSNVFSSLDKLKNFAFSKGIKVEDGWGEGRITMELFEELAEHKLINPTFIVDYPKEVSPLAKSKKDNPEITERFEMFIGGIELVNGFNELNDPIDQKQRFEAQVESRESGDEEAHMMDLDYVTALEYGMPPTAGAGMGIDRFVMMLCGKRSIREVILFPQMRPEEN